MFSPSFGDLSKCGPVASEAMRENDERQPLSGDGKDDSALHVLFTLRIVEADIFEPNIRRRTCCGAEEENGNKPRELHAKVWGSVGMQTPRRVKTVHESSFVRCEAA